MTKKKNKKRVAIHRRQFLRGSCAGVGLAAFGSQLKTMGLMRSAMAQTTAPGYKALVCVYLAGGNDDNNLLIPTDGELRDQYDTGRGILALDAASLHTITPDDTTQGFGLNPNCSELAGLFNSGDLAFVSNVGTLAYPIASREEYRSSSVPVPFQLFSHSDQSVQWQTGISDQAFRSGWGGKVATELDPLNGDGARIPMAVSLDGTSSYLIGDTISQYVLSANGVSSLSGYGTNYGSALNADGSYRDTDAGWRLRALEEVSEMARADESDLFAAEYGQVFGRARDAEGKVSTALTEAAAAETAGGFTFDGLFMDAGATGRLGDQLKMVARMIAGRAATGNSRQIFFVRFGGFDTHQSQLSAHAPLMAEVSASLKAFHDSLGQLGMLNDVTTFTASDFNRTFTPNGVNASAGADHAWGGHAMVMGGAVRGRKIYGTFPSLQVGAGMDVDSSRGRFFPTTAVEQYSAVLAKWFGVDTGGLDAIFPNLYRFDDPFGVGSNLTFL